MQDTMYDIKWIYDDNARFSECIIEQVQVIRRSILPGHVSESVSVKTATGKKIQASPDLFFATEQAANEYIRKLLNEIVLSIEFQIKKHQEEIDVIKKYLQ
jgi:hypothetical protein